MAERTYKGEKFEVTIIEVTQERFSQEKAKELLTDEQFESCKNVLEFEQLKAKRIDGEKPKFEAPQLGNYTLEGLIDAIGKQKEERKDSEKLEKIYIEALKARLANQQSESAPVEEA